MEVRIRTSTFLTGFLIQPTFGVEVDDVVLEYTINYRKRFFLYGKHAQQIIKTISARSNVRIFYPEFNIKEQTFKEAVPMTLEGSFENVLKYAFLVFVSSLLACIT